MFVFSNQTPLSGIIQAEIHPEPQEETLWFENKRGPPEDVEASFTFRPSPPVKIIFFHFKVTLLASN